MLFITNREPVGSIRTRKGRAYKFDLNKNAPANSVFYCERKGENDFAEIGSGALMDKLRECKAEQLLFYIHGFSNLPEEHVFPRALELQKLFDAEKKNLVEVIPLIWPCDNDFGLVGDYWDDQKSADMSGFTFARVLEKFMLWREANHAPCLKRMNVISHSMGNRVLRETLAAWDKYDLANGVPLLFRNTFMMAADVVNETLEAEERGHLISEASRNVSVYYASDDLALRASKVSNLKNKVASRRLGHTGPEDMDRVQKNVFAIDCDDVNSKYDFPTGHGYFASDKNGKPGKVFTHMFNTLDSGRVSVDDPISRTHIIS